MNWSNFYSLKDFKRLSFDNIIDSYVLITDRVINRRFKRLSILNRLFTNQEKFLIPNNIYKFGGFTSTVIFNWINIDDKWYRICSKGENKDFVINATDKKIIFIDNIQNSFLKQIALYYHQ